MKIKKIHPLANKKLRLVAALCTFALIAAAIAELPLRQIFADGAGGDQGGANGGGCSLTDAYPYFDTCYGAVWRWYPLEYGGWFNSQTDTITIPASGNVAGGSVTGCKALGVDGYYRLGLAKHQGSARTAYTTSSGDGSSQAGLIPVRGIWNPNNIYPGGAGQWTLTNYISNTTTYEGDLSWQTAYDKFLYIANNGTVDGPNGQKLGWSDVSIFCGNKPDDPGPDPDPVKQKGTFWSKSSVSIPAQGDVSAHNETSPKDGEVDVKFSTNQASVNVTFSHRLFYGKNLYQISDGNQEEIGEDTPSKFHAATTKYRVLQQGKEIQARTDFDTGGSGDKSGNTVKETTVTISLNPGETKSVCQQIKYIPKSVTMKGDPVLNDKNEVVRYEFKQNNARNNGNDGSRACVKVTRPKAPTDNPPAGYPGPTINGNPNGKVVFAGEDGGLEWKAKAESYLTRRYAAHQAIAYSVDPSIPYANGITSGSSEYKGTDVCSYYTSSSKHGGNCKYYINESVTNSGANFTTPADVGKKVNVVVPETIGQKYCNSLGYKYQYWYGVEKFRGGDDEGDDIAPKWTHESGKDYWVVFNAACRSIAKKPSAAIWNGSTLSAAGITGSLSPRYPITAIHTELSNAGGDPTTFGTWTEYLNVIGGNVKGVASGAALSQGSGNNEVSASYNSPLTISNSGGHTPIGSSGVSGSGQAFVDRIKTYFTKELNEAGNKTNTLPETTYTTNIYNFTGDTINHNIAYSDTKADNTPYTNIYDLPQNIIFVDGDLNISSNVTRIDAWLIVNGTLNTCSDFNSSTDSSGACSAQLTINGPVVAKSINPRRSFGSEAGAARAFPAEIFNLRQDTFLWAYGKSGNYGVTYKEVYSRELAPRY